MLSGLKPSLSGSFSHPIPESAERRAQDTSEVLPALLEMSRPGSMAERWANYVLTACKSKRDPRTLAIWARQAAVSYATLCESCRLINVQPRQARDFARVLRILVRSSLDSAQIASYLDISDRRTLHNILDKAGVAHSAASPGEISVLYFLDNQRFIAPDNAGLKIIRSLFAQR